MADGLKWILLIALLYGVRPSVANRSPTRIFGTGDSGQVHVKEPAKDDAGGSASSDSSLDSIPAEGFSVFAFRNPMEKLIRVYGQFKPSVIGNDSSKGQRTRFAGCLMKGHNKEQLVYNVAEIKGLRQVSNGSEEDSLQLANYLIDCHDPGAWADKVVIRLDDGKELGQDIEIILMDGHHKGKLAVCSQSIYSETEFMKEWVEHQFSIGADEIILHAPQGAHIDSLFTEDKKDQKVFQKLVEQSQWPLGSQPLQKYGRKRTILQHYWSNTLAEQQMEDLVASACHYRLRYAYDYIINFDVDEFWVPGRDAEEQSLSEFLDRHMSKKAASIGFKQVDYPMECATRNHGPYLSRFTLRERLEGLEKLAVRPNAIESMNNRELLEALSDYMAKGSLPQLTHRTIPPEMAFLKHIRSSVQRSDDGNFHYNRCEFGVQLDPLGTGLTPE